MTVRELAKLAQHIIKTYPEYYKIYRRARIHLEQDPPAEPQSAARHGHRRRRHEDRLHQGGRLRPGRLGGAERAAPDRGRQRPQDDEGARRRRPASCSNGASAASRRGRCSPTARRSARPSFRRRQGPRAAGRRHGGQAAGAARRNATSSAREGRLHRPGAAPVAKGQPIGMLKVWRGENVVLGSAAAGGRERRARQPDAARLRCRRRARHQPVPRRRRPVVIPAAQQ